MLINKPRERKASAHLSLLPASISLEAALVLPLILILLTSLLYIQYIQLQLVSLRYALDQTAEEMALLFPAAEGLLEEGGESAQKVLDALLLPEEKSLLKTLAGDYASTLFLSPWLERRIDHWLEVKKSQGGYVVAPHQREMSLHFMEDGHALELRTFIAKKTLFGCYEREIDTVIPLWSVHTRQARSNEADDSPEKSADDSIWEADNFSRGRYFRKEEGANLPLNYPVLASFQNGEARAIKSMDLTAPSYADSTLAEEAIRGHIHSLAAFQGYQSSTGRRPSIDPGEIRQRTLLLIIPKNTPPAYTASLWARLQSEARAAGVKLSVKARGHSYRYQHSSQEEENSLS